MLETGGAGWVVAVVATALSEASNAATVASESGLGSRGGDLGALPADGGLVSEGPFVGAGSLFES